MSRDKFIEWKIKHLNQYNTVQVDLLKKIKKDYLFRNEIDFCTFIKGYFSTYFEALFLRMLNRNPKVVPVAIDYRIVKHDLDNYFNL